MTFEIVTSSGRHGRTDSLFHAKMLAREVARRTGETAMVFHLRTSDLSDGRYGETCHYSVSAETARETR